VFTALTTVVPDAEAETVDVRTAWVLLESMALAVLAAPAASGAAVMSMYADEAAEVCMLESDILDAASVMGGSADVGPSTTSMGSGNEFPMDIMECMGVVAVTCGAVAALEVILAAEPADAAAAAAAAAAAVAAGLLSKRADRLRCRLGHAAASSGTTSTLRGRFREGAADAGASCMYSTVHMRGELRLIKTGWVLSGPTNRDLCLHATQQACETHEMHLNSVSLADSSSQGCSPGQG